MAIPINIYLLGWRFVDLARHRAPYYLHRDETLGQYVPALSGKRAVLAHWAQTVDYYTKRDEVARFFDPDAPDALRTAVLQRYGVGYVLAGEDEAAGFRQMLRRVRVGRVVRAAGPEGVLVQLQPLAVHAA